MSRLSIGELEELVLLTLLHLSGSGYAAEVASVIEARTGRAVATATAYMVMRRLEDRGFTKSVLGESLPERGGRPRRYFQICAEAMPILRASRDGRLALWDGLEDLLAAP
jgi:PadR family transcriptional regulator PadR